MNSKTQRTLQLLQKQHQEILELSEGLSEEQFNFRPSQTSWSIAMVIQHLTLSEHFGHLYAQKKMMGGESLPRPGLKSRLMTFFYFIILRLPSIKFKAPKIVSDFPESVELAATLDKWKTTRKSLVDFVEGFPNGLWNKTIYKSPISSYGTMDTFVAFHYMHQARHYKQIQNIKKALPQTSKAIN